MASSSKSRPTSDRACLQCQKRKTRCVIDRSGTSCTYCSKVGKSCVFEDRPRRTALTRKNLEAVELRCSQLEGLLHRLNPDVDIGNDIENIVDTDVTVQPEEDLRASPTRSSTEIPGQGKSPQHDQPKSQDYEWDESPSINDTQVPGAVHDPQNTLGSSAAAGYLGNSSSSNFLESISSMLSADPGSLVANAGDVSRGERTVRSHDMAFSNRMSTSLAHENLIQAYFVGYNTSYPIFHERSFREQCGKRRQIPARSPWHICYYMVLAVGEWLSGLCTDETSLYYEAARSRLGIEVLESGSLSTVQALLLLGNYLQKRDRPNTGYNYIGLAYRVALGLGLHREAVSPSNGLSFHLQRRRQIFWVLYCFESGFSLTTGRPTLVSDSFIDARKPSNVDESLNHIHPGPLHEVNYPTTSSAIIAQARLAAIANKIYSGFLSAKAPANVDHLQSFMEHSIENWRRSLPDYFERLDVPRWFLGPRAVVLWREANIRILLLIASQRYQSDPHDTAVTAVKCQEVAAKTVSEIAEFCHNNPDVIHTGLSWYAVYFLLQATLAFGVSRLSRWRRAGVPQMLNVDVEKLATWDVVYSSAYQCLQTLSLNNKLAAQTMVLLQRLHDPLTRASTDPRSTASPQSERVVVPDISAGRMVENIDLRPEGEINPPQQPNWPTINGPLEGGGDFLFESLPDDLIATDFVGKDWVGAIDPSLHVFFDQIDHVGDILNNVQGFPNMMEQDDFAYMTSGASMMRGPPMNDSSNT